MALIEDLAVAGLFGGPHGCDPPVSAPDRIGLERLGNLCISLNPSLRAKPSKADSSLRAQRSNPFLLANQPLMDYRVAMPLAMTTSADLP